METKRSKGMIVWLVVAPAVLLLAALAGVNWKVFHLAYCKQLMSSKDFTRRTEGLKMALAGHIRKGMPVEEVRAILAPAGFTETDWVGGSGTPTLRRQTVYVEGLGFAALLGFDEDDRLHSVSRFVPENTLTEAEHREYVRTVRRAAADALKKMKTTTQRG